MHTVPFYGQWDSRPVLADERSRWWSRGRVWFHGSPLTWGPRRDCRGIRLQNLKSRALGGLGAKGAEKCMRRLIVVG